MNAAILGWMHEWKNSKLSKMDLDDTNTSNGEMQSGTNFLKKILRGRKTIKVTLNLNGMSETRL